MLQVASKSTKAAHDKRQTTAAFTMTLDDAAPSAPPLDGVPVVQAAPVMASSCPPMAASAVATAVPSASMPPKASVPPPGMVASTTTTTFPDGRQVTVTEYKPAANGSATRAGPAPAASTAAPAASYHPPRRDLGSRPVNITCPYCRAESVRTRINHNCGDCTLISVIILFLFCLPFFWILFICPSCQDVEHHCSNCGRLVGKSRAECCS
ncbi:hypothetical protein ACHAXT_004059 [Thalassiosira profunda]